MNSHQYCWAAKSPSSCLFLLSSASLSRYSAWAEQLLVLSEHKDSEAGLQGTMGLCVVAQRAFSISHPQSTALRITGQKGVGRRLPGKKKLGKCWCWLEMMIHFFKCDSPQSNVVEGFLRVPLIAGFLYRLNSSTVRALLRGYGVSPKIKSVVALTEEGSLSFALRKCIVSTKR